MVRTVCTDEKEHALTMMRELKQMKQDDDHCDFTIKVQGHEFHAHKVILSAGSLYFKAMLRSDTTESREGRVEMKDVDFECVKSCIDFMYSGKFDIPGEKIKQLLHVAIMMQLEKVKEAVCYILDKELSAENFYETRNISDMYNLQALSTKCEKYFDDNVMAISVQPGFVNETKNFVSKILKSKALKLNEEEKFAIILSWAGQSPKRKKDLFESVKILKLEKVSSEYLNDLLENHPAVTNDFCLYKLISKHLVENVKETKQGQKAPSHSDCEKRIILFDSFHDCLQSFNLESYEVRKFHNERINKFEDYSATFVDSCIYILCANKSVYRLHFKGKDSKWERMQDMIDDHGRYPPNAVLSGSLLVIGTSSGEATKATELFNPVLNRWVKLQDKPSAVGDHTLTTVGGSVYCIGGGSETYNVSRSFCKFTPSSSEWIDLEPMKKARMCCGAVAVGERIFVNGGSDENAFEGISEVECYNVRSGQWTYLSPMPESHHYSNLHYLNGWIFTVDCNGDSNHVAKYDIKNDKWFEVLFSDNNEIEIYESVMVQL